MLNQTEAQRDQSGIHKMSLELLFTLSSSWHRHRNGVGERLYGREKTWVAPDLSHACIKPQTQLMDLIHLPISICLKDRH